MILGRVGRALVVSELVERLRDRWVLIITALFVLLASGISLYGRSAADAQSTVTAPSIVTLSTFLVPLVALVLGHDAIVGERERNTLGLLLSLPVRRGEVLLAKYIGRALALCLAVGVGLGVAAMVLEPGHRAALLALIPPTLLLGAAFLSIGTAISALTRHRATAASLVVVLWFLLVFFYDLGILAALVATDGALSQDTVAWLVTLNPAGLYRTGMLVSLVGTEALSQMGLAVALPSTALKAALWAAWIIGPLLVGAAALHRRQAVTG
ncbi:MAG: ABC transporter permease subunit [Oligoflexia bacterium]|nr:ABC transporter permease subunit [Oligoflexia bacterium]